MCRNSGRLALQHLHVVAQVCYANVTHLHSNYTSAVLLHSWLILPAAPLPLVSITQRKGSGGSREKPIFHLKQPVSLQLPCNKQGRQWPSTGPIYPLLRGFIASWFFVPPATSSIPPGKQGPSYPSYPSSIFYGGKHPLPPCLPIFPPTHWRYILFWHDTFDTLWCSLP